MTPNDPTLCAIKHGITGFTAWLTTLGFSWVVFDEWMGRVSLILGVVIAILTIISILSKLLKK
jgi:hypothetical protein